MAFEIIKRNFDRGLWTARQVALCVRAGAITEEQYQEITGEAYAR